MRKLIVSEWISLDGVFDASTFDQWFMPYQSESRIKHIQKQSENSGARLYGRTTYEELFPYWSPLTNNEMGIADKLNSQPKFVVSTSLEKADWNNTTVIKVDVVDAINKLKQQPGGNIMLDGSATLVQSLLPTGLIDELQFLIHPVIAGSGKRFFKDDMMLTGLELIETKPLDAGVVLMRYRQVKK